MTHSLVALALILSVQPETGRVSGRIVEARTNVPLAAVLIKIQSTGQQSFSDADGRFEIADVPVGAQTLVVSVIGYGLVRKDVTVPASDVVDITIPVAGGASTYVEDVAVSASPFREAEPGVPSQSVLGSRELLALRGLIADDPFRAVQVLPGVATGDDFRAEFAVRGLGPQHIGVAIDGVDSPLLFHTVRAVLDTGSIGLVNSDILESATLLSGPYPQKQAAHLGSRLDFTTRDGSRERLTVRALASASAISTVWEGPLTQSKRASWLVAARKSYIDWLLRQIDSTTDTTFGFTDAQGKFTFDLTPRQSLRLSFIAGRSVLRETEEPGPNTLDHAANNTYIGNLQWRFTPSTKLSVAQQAYVLKADYANRVIDGRTRDEGSDLDVTWKGDAEWNPAPGHFVEFGARAQRLDATRIDRAFTNTASITLLDAKVDTWSAAGWAQYRWMPTSRLSVTPGVRFDHWPSLTENPNPGAEPTNAIETSPWLLSEFEVRPGTRLRFGAGIQRQAPTIDQSLDTIPGTVLYPERARTVEAGIEQQIGSGWRLTASTYYRKDEERLRYADTEVRLIGNQLRIPQNPHWENAMTGTTKGIEISLGRRSVNGLNGWISYAWNDSTLRDERGPGGVEEFPSDYDQRHTFNSYVAYSWSGRTSLSARMRYGSNFPIVGYVQEGPAGYVLSSERNGIRLPAYSRVDVRADRTFTYRRSRLTLFIEVVNALNHENYRSNSPGFNLSTRRVFDPIEELFPILPVAGVLFEF